MFRLALVSLAAVSAAYAQADGPGAGAAANPTDTSAMRLNGKRFPFTALPYQADTSPPTTTPVYRGPQSGYNNCTGAPADQSALCQTLVVNSIDDFCLFAPPTLMDVGDAEGETVSYCTKAKSNWKSRTVPQGTFTGVQFINAPSYVEVTGFINQQNLNIPEGHYGGELDSGGQDQRGNPIGGLAYSNSLPSSVGGAETQSIMWHMFIGGGQFCMKLCDPKAPNASGICRHTLDTVGCNINVPAAYVDNSFTSCDADDQLPVATTNTAIPASSNCKTYQSTDLYPVTSGVPSSTAATSTTTSASSSATGAAGSSSTTKGSSSSSSKGSTTTTSGASGSSSTSSSSTGGAASLSVSVFAVIGGLVAYAVMA